MGIQKWHFTNYISRIRIHILNRLWAVFETKKTKASEHILHLVSQCVYSHAHSLVNKMRKYSREMSTKIEIEIIIILSTCCFMCWSLGVIAERTFTSFQEFDNHVPIITKVSEIFMCFSIILLHLNRLILHLGQSSNPLRHRHG